MLDTKQLLLENLSLPSSVTGKSQVKRIQQYEDFVSICRHSDYIDVNLIEPNRLFFWSDPHFFHNNIIKYSNRPFDDVEQMNETMIRNFNNVVGPNDVSICVGDVAFKGVDIVNSTILSKLNGYKILVIGNHDFEYHRPKIIKYDFDEIHLFIKLDNFIITHHPLIINLPQGMYNIHGHIHERQMSDSRYKNVGVDCNNFTPVSFEQIKRTLKE